MRTLRKLPSKLPRKKQERESFRSAFAVYRLWVLPILIFVQFSVHFAVRTSENLSLSSVNCAIALYMIATIVYRNALGDCSVAQLLLVPEILLDAVLIIVCIGYPVVGYWILTVSAVALSTCAVVLMAMQHCLQHQGKNDKVELCTGKSHQLR
jgi:hypothetical protein